MQDAMPTYGFRLKVTLPPGQILWCEAEELELLEPSHLRPIVLRAYSGGAIKESQVLLITSAGYTSEEDADQAGQRTRTALRLSLATLRTGIDAGDRATGLRFGQAAQDAVSHLGVMLQGDAHGLTIVPDDSRTRFMAMDATGVVSSPIEWFLRHFRDIYSAGPVLSDRQQLAVALYNLSYFDSSSRARLVTLVSAIEAVAPPLVRSEIARAHVDTLIAQTHSAQLSEGDRESLVTSLENLKNESIGTACRAFIQDYGSPEDVGVWNTCHKARHKMLHSGKIPNDLNVLVSELDALVRRALLRSTLGIGADEA